MSKPTHILVPIDNLHVASQFDEITNTMIETSFVVAAIDCIEVDLSEEGIEAMGDEWGPMTYDRLSYKRGYQQCAKDLLNTKS